MIPSKEQNNFPVTDPKEMRIWHLPNKEFKISVLRQLSELQHTKIPFNEISKATHEQKEKFNRKLKLKWKFKVGNYFKKSNRKAGAVEYNE